MPARDPTDAPRIFSPEYYAKMRALEAGAWWNAGMRSIAASLLDTVSLSGSGKFLDAGCGSGQSMEWLASRLPQWTGYGIDISQDAVVAASHNGCSVGIGSVLLLPFVDSEFDLVISLDVLQHMPLGGGDLSALREFRRVLSPGGILLVRTNAQSFPRVPDDWAEMYRRYDPEILRETLECAGLDVLRLSRANSILGFAEIPREFRARKVKKGSYYGLLSKPSSGFLDSTKRRILELEGKLIARGVSLPFGRAIFALCKAS